MFFETKIHRRTILAMKNNVFNCFLTQSWHQNFKRAEKWIDLRACFTSSDRSVNRTVCCHFYDVWSNLVPRAMCIKVSTLVVQHWHRLTKPMVRMGCTTYANENELKMLSNFGKRHFYLLFSGKMVLFLKIEVCVFCFTLLLLNKVYTNWLGGLIPGLNIYNR